MRTAVFLFLSFGLINCASRKGIQRIVAAHSQTFPLSQLSPEIVGQNLDIETSRGPGLPAQAEVVKTGALILPLLFYNQFQASYQVVLGQEVLDEPWGDYVEKKLKSLSTALSRAGIDHVSLEVKKVLAHGKYISGHAYFVLPSYYASAIQSINISRSKNATAEMAISVSWKDSDGNDQSKDASIKLNIDKRGIYSGQLRTLLGKTISLQASDIQFHLHHQIFSSPPYIPNHPMITQHLFRLCDLLVLCLDELCETVLAESKGEEINKLPADYSLTLMQARNILWEKLRNNKLGFRFEKGYGGKGGFRSGSFYDFVSNKGRLTIDVGINREKFPVEQYLINQSQRTSQFHHLYFRPEEILDNITDVLEQIKNNLK